MTIDLLEETYSQITELSLNHNHLISLKGVEQFGEIQKLSLNFNQLWAKEELLKLRSPGKLLELSVKGNPKLDGDPQCAEFVKKLFKK